MQIDETQRSIEEGAKNLLISEAPTTEVIKIISVSLYAQCSTICTLFHRMLQVIEVIFDCMSDTLCFPIINSVRERTFKPSFAL